MPQITDIAAKSNHPRFDMPLPHRWTVDTLMDGDALLADFGL
jgi:hypothetical protein